MGVLNRQTCKRSSIIKLKKYESALQLLEHPVKKGGRGRLQVFNYNSSANNKTKSQRLLRKNKGL